MRRGFTLVEVLIATAIAGMVGALLVQLLVQNNTVYYQQTAKVSTGTALNSVTISINNDIKGSATIVSGYPLNNPTVISTSNSIVLGLASLDGSGNVILNTYDYLTISQDSNHLNVLREVIYPDPSSSRKSSNKVLASNVSSIVFNYYDSSGNVVAPTLATKINFVITISSTTGGQPQVSSANSTVSLRNQ